MLGWGHSKRRANNHLPEEPEPASEPAVPAGSASVQRLLILLRDESAVDEVPAGH